MKIQRLAPQEILTDAPLEAARESVWYGLRDAGVNNVVIDVNRNVVVGSTGVNMTTYGQNITASFISREDGTLISIRSEAQVQGTIDFGKSKRQAKAMADKIENSLAQGERPKLARSESIPEAPLASSVPEAPLASSVAPIASPFGSPVVPGLGGPVYGQAMPPQRGTAVLIYGLLGVSCCQIAGPMAWYYGGKALKEYGQSDPGDKTMVRIGWILGMIGTAILLIRIGSYTYLFAKH